ncbi:MAG: winged helix-turn-helix domain-containing protein [Streptosporangiaceae bacterium]
MEAALLEAVDTSQGQLLGVVPVEGTDTALVIVGHIVRLGQDARPITEPEQGGLSVDAEARTVQVDGRKIPLTYQEYELLVHLTSSPGRVWSRAQLLSAGWGPTESGSVRTVDVHIHRLRAKIGPYRDQIITIRRLGYMYTKR